jgi:capsular polysaccharide biosynthesis protein
VATPADHDRARIRANHAQFARIIRALAADDDAPRLATLSVVAQCVFYRNCHAIVTRMYPEIDPLADHITRFSLAAIMQPGEPTKDAHR